MKICFRSLKLTMSLHTRINRFIFYLSNLNLKLIFGSEKRSATAQYLIKNSQGFHSSSVRNDLMEFFDNRENWGKEGIQVGRPWKLEELRIKSNSDLHKLWYVLLKEKNMLLTMQHEYNAKFLPFPNPERIDKVDISMENLEAVVRERNKAYFELETGETGERPAVEKINCFGLPYTHKMSQYSVPKELNEEFLAEDKLINKTDDHKYIKKFLAKLEEKRKRIECYDKVQQFKEVCKILSEFPDTDDESLKAEYPDVDIEKARRHKLSRGHRENPY